MNRGILLTALSATLYGSIGYFGSTLIHQGMSVADMLFWRFAISSVLLLPFLPSLLKNKPDFKALFLLFIFGILFYGCGTAFYFEASKSIGTGLGMVIFFAYPIFVVCMSVFFHKTHLSTITVASLALITLGCIFIACGQDFRADLLGILLATLSGICYALYLFCSKSTSLKVEPLLATFVVCLGSAAAFVFYRFLAQDSFYWPTTSFAWSHIFLFALVGTVLPVLFMLVGLKTLSAGKASIISVLEPVTTLAVGALILHEAITPIQLLGAVIILSSAIIVQFDKQS